MSTTLRKAAVLVSGVGVYGTAMFMTYQYVKMNQELPTQGGGGCSHVDSPNRTQQFETIASSYDKCIHWEELFQGTNLLRRFLLRHAKGDVLEVGAGTARNLPYYPRAVKRIVLMDISPNMLEQAQAKIEPGAKVVTLRADAAHLPLPSHLFDTVIDTFGLCSYDSPVDVLKEMARVAKPNGAILLLEHGRSKSYEFINRHLDRNAEEHASKWGCVWNRDLDWILEQSGLDIEVVHKWHFGTTYYVVCRPPSKTA